MIDNLRRSLTPISWVMASVAGWTAVAVRRCRPVPGAAHPDAVHGADLRYRRRHRAEGSREATVRGHFNALLRDVVVATAQVALRVVLLAHSAWLMGDAIMRTLYPAVSQPPHLLEWRTASQAQKAGDNTLFGYYRMMYGAVVIALVGLAIPLAAEFDRRRRRPDLRVVLDRIAGLRLAGQPLGRDRGPADRRGGRQGQAARLSGAAPGSISRPSSRPSTTCCRRTISRKPPRRWWRPHIADQYRHLPAVDPVGARLRLDQPRQRGRTARSDDRHDREAGDLSRPSLQLVRHADAEAAAAALRVERRQRQSRRPSRRRRRRLQRMGDGAGSLPRRRLPRPARRRHHSRAKASRRCPTTAAS